MIGWRYQSKLPMFCPFPHWFHGVILDSAFSLEEAPRFCHPQGSYPDCTKPCDGWMTPTVSSLMGSYTLGGASSASLMDGAWGWERETRLKALIKVPPLPFPSYPNRSNQGKEREREPAPPCSNTFLLEGSQEAGLGYFIPRCTPWWSRCIMKRPAGPCASNQQRDR